VLSFILFSLLSAFLLLTGFASVAAISGSTSLKVLMTSGPDASVAFAFLAAGFLIKAGAIGVHVWLPGAYSEADDDFTAMLSGVVSKVAVFGLMLGSVC
jgi:formate hydrogenlyase subunit 3/multisubunit Na+/H+ antiporter MnhD subunit